MRRIVLVAGGIAVLVGGMLVVTGGALTTLEHTVVIQASPAKVWKIVSDLESVRHFNHMIKAVRRITPEHAGPGAARECDLKDGGTVRERVTAWDPGKSITIELYESPWPLRTMSWTTVIGSEGAGTRVTQILTYRPKGVLGAFLNAVIMKKKMQADIGGVFVDLKAYVERQP